MATILPFPGLVAPLQQAEWASRYQTTITLKGTPSAHAAM
jgi:hypothetical protein